MNRTFKDMDEALFEIAKELRDAEEYSPRGLKVKELINFSFVLEDAAKSIIMNPARKFSKKYIGAEMLWYVSGSDRAEDIASYASMWDRIKNEDGTVNSAYGKIVLWDVAPNFGGTQWDWAKQKLIEDADTRQATINYNQVRHKWQGNKDYVCTINSQFLLRNNRLHLITNMRSQDAIWGMGPDVCWFSYLQQKMVEELQEHYPGLETGQYFHNCGSLHVYERHFGMLESIIEEYEQRPVNSEIMPIDHKTWVMWRDEE